MKKVIFRRFFLGGLVCLRPATAACTLLFGGFLLCHGLVLLMSNCRREGCVVGNAFGDGLCAGGVGVYGLLWFIAVWLRNMNFSSWKTHYYKKMLTFAVSNVVVCAMFERNCLRIVSSDGLQMYCNSLCVSVLFVKRGMRSSCYEIA